MGGSAFAQAGAADQPTLNTPRMSRTEYKILKTIYLGRLQKHFPDQTVSVLIEAPEKKDYGDIDFVIKSDDQVDFIELARKLGAAGVICSSSGKHQRCSIGVPKDGSRSSRETVVYKNVTNNNSKKAQPSTTRTIEEYAQIDIEVVGSEDFGWHSFYCSYGDMGALLGNITRNLGFTISDKGLVLRLRELDYAKKMRFEQVADKDGMLWLSNDPDKILTFMDLSYERYQEGFSTVEDFFVWLRKCRLIDLDVIKKKRNISRDRQKETKRSLYSTFFEDWLPKSCGVGIKQEEIKQEEIKQEEIKQEEIKQEDPDDQRRDSVEEKPRNDDRILGHERERLCGEAVRYFDVDDEFRAMRTALQRSLCNLWAERLLKPIVASASGAKDKKLAEIMRAFRRWVCFVDGTVPHLTVEPHTDAQSQMLFFLKKADFLVRFDDTPPEFNNLELAQSFVAEHWEELKGLERARAKGAREADAPPTTS